MKVGEQPRALPASHEATACLLRVRSRVRGRAGSRIRVRVGVSVRVRVMN